MSRHAAAPTPVVVVVRPGDRVLLVTSDAMDQVTAEQAKARLARDFPGVEFTIASRIDAVVVQRPEPAPRHAITEAS